MITNIKLEFAVFFCCCFFPKRFQSLFDSQVLSSSKSNANRLISMITFMMCCHLVLMMKKALCATAQLLTEHYRKWLFSFKNLSIYFTSGAIFFN